MNPYRRYLLGAALLLSAAGAPPPGCDPAHDGVQMCMTGQVCRCAHDAGGILSGRAPGWRWSCDIMQACETDQPADLAPQSGQGQGQGQWQGPVYVTPNYTPPLPPR